MERARRMHEACKHICCYSYFWPDSSRGTGGIRRPCRPVPVLLLLLALLALHHSGGTGGIRRQLFISTADNDAAIAVPMAPAMTLVEDADNFGGVFSIAVAAAIDGP